MSQVTEFKERYKNFVEALEYLVKNATELQKDQARWAKIQNNFRTKYEKPLDDIFDQLTTAEKNKLAPLYLRRRAEADKDVQKIMGIFDAEIIGTEMLE